MSNSKPNADKINTLTDQLESVRSDNRSKVSELRAALQTEWNAVFAADKALRDAVEAVQTGTDRNCYAIDDGGIYSWLRFPVSDYRDCLEYLEEYLSDGDFVHIDAEYDALKYYQGGCIVINEGYGRDNGDVYDQDSGKRIVEASEYRDDDGELNEAKRNELIEAWMESKGYFPGVFSMDDHGTVFPVSTTPKAKG